MDNFSKKLIIFVLVTVLAVGLVMQSGCVAEAGSRYYGALKVSGKHLCDKNGKTVQLRGVSTHGINFNSDDGQISFGDYVNDMAFKTLKKSFHANVVRIAMYSDEWGGYCDRNADRKKLLATIDRGVKAAAANDMYVIIDWHVLNVHPNPLDHKKAAKSFFNKVSKKYSKYDNVIYEICNEPNSGTSWKDIKKYASQVIPVIRKNAPKSVIIVGTPTWSQDVDIAASDPLKYKNVLYAFHFYANTHRDDMRKKLSDAYDKGLPVFVSEFGTCDASGNGGFNKQESDKWIKLLDRLHISYVNWSLCNKNETASIIKSSCKKTSGWKTSDLTQSGKWLKKTLNSR